MTIDWSSFKVDLRLAPGAVAFALMPGAGTGRDPGLSTNTPLVTGA